MIIVSSKLFVIALFVICAMAQEEIAQEPPKEVVKEVPVDCHFIKR